jgi:hypothetical protein
MSEGRETVESLSEHTPEERFSSGNASFGARFAPMSTAQAVGRIEDAFSPRQGKLPGYK